MDINGGKTKLAYRDWWLLKEMDTFLQLPDFGRVNSLKPKERRKALE